MHFLSSSSYIDLNYQPEYRSDCSFRIMPIRFIIQTALSCIDLHEPWKRPRAKRLYWKMGWGRARLALKECNRV